MMVFIRFLDRIQHGNRRFIRCLEAIGMAGLVAMVIITTMDVLGAKLARLPVFGSIDLVMMLQMTAISSGIASTLLAGGHIRVMFFLSKFSTPLRYRILWGIDLLCLLLFALAAWRLGVYGMQVYGEGEFTPTARIPLYPAAFGVCLALVPVCVEYALRVIRVFSSEARAVSGVPDEP